MKNNNENPLRYWHDEIDTPYEEGEYPLSPKDLNELVNKVLQYNQFLARTKVAARAMKELRLLGYTNVVCPRCKTAPKMTTTPGGERTTISCQCGYIINGEIYF